LEVQVLHRLVVLFFACPALLCLAEPIVPSNPIDMATEVGSVAGVRNKIVIIQKAMITKRTVTFTTDLESRDRLEYRLLSVNTENLQPIIASLTETLADPDKDYKKPAAGFEITKTEVGGKRIIKIRQAEEGLVLEERAIEMDSDNASTLLTLLKKAQGIRDWMKNKATALQEK
jgi:hypothetical protein